MEYHYIVKTPGTNRGKPRIDGTRITVEMIAEAVVHHGESPQEYQESHSHITVAQIHAALAYYYDHREEIDASIEEGNRFAEELRKQSPSLVQEKLREREQAK
jgi:uncharacterized protein (DUF433 family)